MKSGKYSYRRCKICGRWWNVSVSERKTKRYICPQCSGEEAGGTRDDVA